ncbi:aminoglycoside phosphotransferase [Lentzea kentuckyensis]|uniref:aminoglycoside phosphotransferase n=1 Tax=Lentzea kentuckyensis TaxID=360086 RepID=UPI001B7FFF3F|nr:aminoglycoside phosphotransferase [Lentzea kentuckyensis]
MAHLGVADLTDIAHAAYGRELREVARLRGGSKKGVYRLMLDDGTTGIAYVWRASEDYWPEHEYDPLFGNASGRDLFLTAHTTLSEAGACVPRLVLVDRDVIVVEDLGGDFLEKQLDGGTEVLERLWDDVQAMHQRLSPRYGRPNSLQPADAPPVPDVVLRRALGHLDACCERVPRIAAERSRLETQLRQRHALIEPRTTYGLIHGELGPDHVLVADGRPVLIDIEGVMFFDVEWEHVFLELRFGPHYRPVAGLDPARLSLYRLAQYLSLVEGPLRLLDGDFPHRDAMREIADHNIERALSC